MYIGISHQKTRNGHMLLKFLEA